MLIWTAETADDMGKVCAALPSFRMPLVSKMTMIVFLLGRTTIHELSSDFLVCARTV